MREGKIAVIAAAMIMCGATGCEQRAHSGSPQSSASVSVSVAPPSKAEVLGFEYPVGRWRLASFEELDRATLWVGHIVIRHDQSDANLFRPPGWQPDSPNPRRSAEEALALAEKIREQAARDPEAFERLAREYSEDIVSRDEGGMLGGVRASQLSGLDFLDALSVLKPGDISQPFRTPYGFHILKRYPQPPEQELAGERIVIGYEGVFGLAQPSLRSRAQARELAQEVAARAKKDPRRFRELVGRFSENIDRVAHGDIGVYSTTDPGAHPLPIHRLSQIAVGEVTGPVETRMGFEILKRVPAVARPEYAMAAIEIGFGASSSDQEAAKAEALAAAEQIRKELEAKPEKFQHFQKNHCCDRVRRWTAGRGDLEVTRLLDGLAFDEIAKKPFPLASGYSLIRRLDPRRLPPEKPRLSEVPSPADPDYEGIAISNEPAQLASAARAFIEALRTSSRMSPDAIGKVSETLTRTASYLERSGVDRVSARDKLLATLAQLRTQLGAEQFEKLERFGRDWMIRQMMPAGYDG